MNLNHRDKELTNLHKVADYLSRSLRENLRIFSVDSASSKAIFLSESDKMISCDYKITDKSVQLENFSIESSDSFISGEKVDSKVSDGISSFISSLRESRFDKADVSFNDVLNLFEERSNLDNVRYKLDKQRESFGDANIIKESSEFRKLIEVQTPFQTFITENKEELLNNKDVVDCLNISNAIGAAFATDRISYEDLQEGASFSVDLSTADKSLYEMVCQQELIRQELLESKENFSNLWVGNEEVQNLASCIYSKEEAIRETLVDVIESVPYFAFVTKSDLQEVLTSIYEVNSTDVISKKDIVSFVKKIYEMKKPVKDELIEVLDESYGINATNLKFVPTFSNVAKSHSVLLEVLSMHMEEGVLRDVIEDFSKSIRKKGGVEVLDVNDFITECFQTSDETVNENLLLQYIDVPKLTRDLGALAVLLGGGKMEGGEMGEEEMGMEGEEELAPEEMAPEEEGAAEEEFAPEKEGEEFAPEEGEQGEDLEGGAGQEPFTAEEEEFGAEGPEGAPDEMGGEAPVGDDSAEEMPQNPAEGGLGSLVADLEKLVSGMGMGKKKSRPMPPEQYEG
jgi:hypothetical protein